MIYTFCGVPEYEEVKLLQRSNSRREERLKRVRTKNFQKKEEDVEVRWSQYTIMHTIVHYSISQYTIVHYSISQYTNVHYSISQYIAVYQCTLQYSQYTIVHYSISVYHSICCTLQYTQYIAVYYSILQYTIVHYSISVYHSISQYITVYYSIVYLASFSRWSMQRAVHRQDGWL